MFGGLVNLTVSHISAARRSCDWSVAAWTSRQASDERADQPSTYAFMSIDRCKSSIELVTDD